MRTSIHPAAIVLVLAFATLLTGCSTLGYYAQSAWGELSLVAAREPIDAVLADPARDPALKERLRTARAMRDFAASALALPGNGSFRDFVALDREHVVWTVVATPEFSLEPRRWCFPVAGCVSYRGYFSHDAAEHFAGTLAAEGLDVNVAGADAYSTLGWFADPVLSTMLRGSDYRLAGVLFHELAHQRLYVADDSTFNESFAVVVERAGVRRWLEAHGNPAERAAYRLARERSEGFLSLLRDTRERLARLYGSKIGPERMRAGKAAEFERLRERYRQLRASWNGDPRYDQWFAAPLNNARLALVATYDALVPPLSRLLASLDGDLPAFYRACEGLAALPADQRRERLAQLAAG